MPILLKEYRIEDIVHIRRKLGLTQKQLAKLSGVSQSLIAKIESGRIDPAYSKVISIFETLELELNKNKKEKIAKDIMCKNVIYVSPKDTLDKVIKLMKEKSISQVPVFDGKGYVGSITEDLFISWFSDYGNNIKQIKVADVMKDCFPVIPSDANIDLITEMLKFYKALLVKDKRVVGIITKSDLIKIMR